jgi:hypothetical protein
MVLFDGSGADGFGRTGLDWPAIPLPKGAKLGQFLRGQVLVPFRKILHRVIEPVFLVLWGGFENSAPQDMAEHLISGLIKGLRGLRRLLDLLFSQMLLRGRSGYLKYSHLAPIGANRILPVIDLRHRLDSLPYG